MTSDSNDILNSTNLVSHIDNTPLGIIVWDPNSQITFWSERAALLFEWKPSEVIHKKIADLNLIHHDDIEKVAGIITNIIDGKVSFNRSINRNYTKSGKVIYCEWYNSALRDESGTITSILSLVQDISERIHNEEALQKSEHQLSLIYNSAIDPMWLIQIEGQNQFRFIDINETFTTVTGLTKDQVVGKMMEDVLPVTSHEIVRTKYNEAIATGNVIDYIEIAVHPAGKKVGEIRVIPVKSADGSITKLVGIANDRTDRSKAEEELNELNERLRELTAHLQDVIEEERTEIAREIHDELGQQLTAIKMDIAWVARKGEIKEAPIQERLASTMELLDIAVNTVRRIAMDLRPSILDDLGLQEALIWFGQEFEKRSGISCKIIINDSARKIAPPLAITLFRVFQESLTNIKRHAKASEVVAELLILNDQIRLKITDNGQGFNSNEQSGKKTLGILGMKERIHKLKGDFELNSRVGTGTTIQVTLPNSTTH